MIYLDHNSTTKLAPEVLAKMTEIYKFPINTSAAHQLGQKGKAAVENAREELKKLLNAHSYEVIFTGSSTEATNTVIFGTEEERVFVSKIEHSSVYNCRPEHKRVFEIEVTEQGLIDVSDLKKKIEEVSQNDPTSKFLVSAMLVQNETGAIQPVEEIARITHQNGGLIHCDIVQAVGKIPVDLEKLNVDFASISAHKIHGPQGVGALSIRKGLDIKPLIYGAGQEKSKRAGTLNVAGITGFGEACRLAQKHLADFQKVSELRNFFESEIKKIAQESNSNKVKIFSEEIARSPTTSYFATANCDSQTQLINFDLNGICVSAGTACSSGTVRGSRVLKAMNVAPEFVNSAIRVSFGLENTREEVEKLIAVWRKFSKL